MGNTKFNIHHITFVYQEAIDWQISEKKQSTLKRVHSNRILLIGDDVVTFEKESVILINGLKICRMLTTTEFIFRHELKEQFMRKNNFRI